ncbi:hypothetical protein GCM10009414_22600 [Tatumella terrea]
MIKTMRKLTLKAVTGIRSVDRGRPREPDEPCLWQRKAPGAASTDPGCRRETGRGRFYKVSCTRLFFTGHTGERTNLREMTLASQMKAKKVQL